ncbi:MAG: FHA domain-containing protein [Candidatus Saccharimonadales bacterium]
MEAKLIVVGGKANKVEVPLSLPATIGRGREAHLTVAHPTVSRRHCLVYELDGILMVQDKGSLNGTFIDGERVDSDRILRPGQTLTIGPLTFRAEYDLADISHDVLTDVPAAASASEAPAEVADPPERSEASSAKFLPPPAESPETIHFASDGLNETTDLPPIAPAKTPEPAKASAPADGDSGEFALPVDAEPESESGQFDFLDDEPIGEAAALEPSGLSGGDRLSGGDSGEIFSFADDPPEVEEAKPAKSIREKKSKSSTNGEIAKHASKASANGESPQAKVGSEPAPAVHQSDDELNNFFESLGLD